MNENENISAVTQVFTEYLKANKLRCTPERYAILNAIYSQKGHFEIENLLSDLLNKYKFRVSRATVYNTVNLLYKAKLIVKHQFKNKPQFEKCYNTDPHSHLICTKCGKISEWNNTTLQQNILKAPTRRFLVSSYSLYIYGECAKCQNAAKKKKEETKTKIKKE